MVGTDVDKPSAHRVDHLLIGYSGCVSAVYRVDKIYLPAWNSTSVGYAIEQNHKALAGDGRRCQCLSAGLHSGRFQKGRGYHPSRGTVHKRGRTIRICWKLEIHELRCPLYRILGCLGRGPGGCVETPRTERNDATVESRVSQAQT
jgi:hypothetical protein